MLKTSPRRMERRGLGIAAAVLLALTLGFTTTQASRFLPGVDAASAEDSPLDRCSEISLQPCSQGEGDLDTFDASNDYDPGPGSCVPNGADGRDVAIGVYLNVGDQLTVVYSAAIDGVVYLLGDCADPAGSCVAGADATGPGGVESLFYVSPSDQQLYLVFDSKGQNSGGPVHVSYTIQCAEAHSACCLPDATCELQTETTCVSRGGQFFAEWNLCPPSPLYCDRTPGACCLQEGSCTLLTWFECDSAGGEFYLPGTLCEPDPCFHPGSGACCFEGAGCDVRTAPDCAFAGGTYLGDGSTCNPNPCAPPDGACCLDDGTCSVVERMLCGGAYLGDGTSCDPNPCTPVPTTGACCTPLGNCFVIDGPHCQGTYRGDGTSCDPSPCGPVYGACCMEDHTCILTTATTCDGDYLGEGMSCNPATCEPPAPATGGCCVDQSLCATLTAEDCATFGGSYLGDNAPCQPDVCQTPVASRRTTWGSIKSRFK